MSSFIEYLDPSVQLGPLFMEACKELKIDDKQSSVLLAFMRIVDLKDPATSRHGIRVALLCRAIARFMHLDQKAAFYSGALHDVGKAQTDPKTLTKTSGWTQADTEEIRSHVMDGYRLIRGQFEFSAEVILWHHRFQPNSYPAELPGPLHEYSQGTKVMIPLFGRILALADQFDATHRINDKFTAGPSAVGEWVKEQMFKHNPDQRVLIQELYDADIFTTRVFVPEPEVAA